MPPRFSRKSEHPVIIQQDATDLGQRISPCEAVCPAGVPVRRMMDNIRSNNINEALRWLLYSNPFPEVTGRICPHPCENACNRAKLDRTVGIRALEKYVSDSGLTPQVSANPATGRTASIVGGGLAGLTAAFYLRLFGHQVVLHEPTGQLGGDLQRFVQTGLLSEELVSDAAGKIIGYGVRIEVEQPVAMVELMEQFDAVVVVDFSFPAVMPDGADSVFRIAAVADSHLGVVRAIGEGKRTAVAVDAFLSGISMKSVRRIYVDPAGVIRRDLFLTETRIGPPHTIRFDEMTNLADVPKVTEPSEMPPRREAGLCLHCGECTRCGLCVDICPGDILSLNDTGPVVTYPDECIHCGACLVDCPTTAISYHVPLPMTIFQEMQK